VLEDDLVTSPGFLPYMNNSLRIYADDERVMHVSGFNFPAGWFPPQTGFLRASHPWGWATWERAWQYYSHDAPALLTAVENNKKNAFDLDGYSFHFDELRRNVEGSLTTWAVRWYASIFLRQGWCLYPGRSLIKNIGFDGTGENCHSAQLVYSNIPTTHSVSVKRRPLEECPAILAAHQRHYRTELARWTGTTLQQRIARKISRIMRYSYR
jgi:hypothetical protein